MVPCQMSVAGYYGQPPGARRDRERPPEPKTAGLPTIVRDDEAALVSAAKGGRHVRV